MHQHQATAIRHTLTELRQEIVGIDTLVPLLDGSERRYVFLDNAASTPTFRQVLQCIEQFLPWYSAVHRGTGFKSLVATEVYDRAHNVVGRFVGADLRTNHVIFTKNTTECVNKLSHRFRFRADDVVVTTSMEHHSNDLPWRRNARVIHVGLAGDGYLDLTALQETLTANKGKVRLVAVNGASNITGICSPIHRIAEMAHTAGARIFVDAAQLVPHRPVDMLPDDNPRHIDFLAFSAHKIYAPFGTGVLIGPTSFFEEGEPEMVGGGVAAIVTLDDVEWNHPPHKDEAGSPNVVGGVALAEAISIMQSAGMDTVAAHEQHLLEYSYTRLKKVEGMRFYGPTDNFTDKVGVITFNMEGMHPALVGAILGTEAGIGVRNGYFCAQPYVKKLLHVSAEDAKDTGCGVVSPETGDFAGMVRASFGCYTNEDDVDALVEMVEKISRREYRGKYIQNSRTGAFQAEGYTVEFDKYIPFVAPSNGSSTRTYSESA